MTPVAVVNTLHLNNITKFDFMREKLKNGRFLSVDRAVMTFDLDAGTWKAQAIRPLGEGVPRMTYSLQI
jgi:hypothetical protein